MAREIRILLGVRPGVRPDAVDAVLNALPEGAAAVHDLELDVISVVVEGGADVVNRTHGFLSRSQLFTASLRDDAAVRRHSPTKAARPARWDFVGESATGLEEAICETCGWMYGPAPEGEVEREVLRHTNDVHGGRQEQPPYDD